ncbi:NADPH-dependent 7-cyano-7-deazaguanine reductase [subsurface metagenome]|jgi:7-cyano-7-deazaguanine reductase
MYNEVNPELKARIKGLSMEFTDTPQPRLLIPIPNYNTDVDHKITITSPEFTSLCPLTPTQPDYATIKIEYYPDKKVVELKSLKFYLVSFRNVCIFHESVASKVLRDLVDILKPKKMTITGDFTVRGGIHTVVEATYEA